MRHLFPSQQGGRLHHRTGDRTPLQWDHTPQYWFLHLPRYLPAPGQGLPTPTVVGSGSGGRLPAALNVRALLTFRRNTPELQADAPFEPVWMGQGGYPFVHRRRRADMLALNARGGCPGDSLPGGRPAVPGRKGFTHGCWSAPGRSELCDLAGLSRLASPHLFAARGREMPESTCR